MGNGDASDDGESASKDSPMLDAIGCTANVILIDQK